MTGPVVVKFVDKYSEKPAEQSSLEKKLLKSGKALKLNEVRKEPPKPKGRNRAEPEDEENLKNDLALQRLLSESHILSSVPKSHHSGAELTLKTLDSDGPIGNARIRTLDERMKEISAKNGTLKARNLEKMPMAMRKGMIKARTLKTEKYEKEAKEAGIVLSRTRKGELRSLDNGRGVTSASDRLGLNKSRVTKMRDRGLKINTIGRSTRNGLVISKAEIERLSSKPKDGKKGKKGGRRR
ncbi:unnamed protein product [Kuraishia capsulata CBS 1993]|uniref:Uncharacterized protein n=1 Tax=Kuraishia capsulata CBS 1993 TaxID=1382522 RepID=W6MGA6_9ASCO|nr:uncharacterized protein KUCA_T00001041001 [Kuraishia capsulata CBS 1993]CDK25074.1 unnamed protein product [Kuraishia capsulata CBS 1993]